MNSIIGLVMLLIGVCAAYPSSTNDLGGVHQQRQFGLHGSPPNSPAVGSQPFNRRLNGAQPHDNDIGGSKPNPVQRIFTSQTVCADLCLAGCQAMLNENDATLFVCPRLKPVEKSLHERLIANASWPWLVFLVVLASSLLFCCACVCWSCCCREGCSLASNGSGRDSNSSQEPLAADRRIEEIIGEHPSSSLPPKRSMMSGSKYVVDV